MKIEKVKKLVSNLHEKTEHVIHIRNLKQALNHRLAFKKGTKSDSILSKCMAKTMYWCEY